MSVKDLIQRMIDAVASGETRFDGVKIERETCSSPFYKAKVSCHKYDLDIRIAMVGDDAIVNQNCFDEQFVDAIVELFGKRCNVYYDLIIATGSSHTQIDDFDFEQDSNIVDNHAMLLIDRPLHDDLCTINWLCGDCYSCADGNDWRKVLSEVKRQASEEL